MATNKNHRWLSIGLCLLLVIVTVEAIGAVPSQIGTAARDAKAKVVKHTEEILGAAARKKSYLEALQVNRILGRLDPQNPLVLSTGESTKKAFLEAFLREQNLKSLNKLRGNYLRGLEENLKKAQKTKDILGIRECSSMILQLDPGRKDLEALKKKADEAIERTPPEKIIVSDIQKIARRNRDGYIRALMGALRRHDGKNEIMAALECSRMILEIDASNNEAKSIWDEKASVILDAAMADAKERGKPLPLLKRAQDLLGNYLKNLELGMKTARAKSDLLGILETTKLILEVDPGHKVAMEFQDEARENLLKTAIALGRPLREEDLVWYKIEGKYVFDGNKVMFNTGVLGIGQMANNVIITCQMKARRPQLAYGWGAEKKWNSPAGGDENFDGNRWVRFAVVATPHVGFWLVDGKVHRPDGCNFIGRLIVYPRGGQVELKEVRIYELR